MSRCFICDCDIDEFCNLRVEIGDEGFVQCPDCGAEFCIKCFNENNLDSKECPACHRE